MLENKKRKVESNMAKMLALNTEGRITYCTVDPEMRGRGRCNHIEHQNEGETASEFIERISIKQKEIEQIKEISEYSKNAKEISQEEINDLASKIDKIAEVKVTKDNFYEVLSSLKPEQIDEITRLSFNAAPSFSLPITNEHYEDENMKNKLFFANLPKFGVGGNTASIAHMFKKVGPTQTANGVIDIENSYVQGLTPHEYFKKQFSARDALINKGVSTSAPGYCIWENSIVSVKNTEDQIDSLVEIPWKEVSIGDEFEDGSVVVSVEPWNKKVCYELKLQGYKKIVLSHDHLLYGEIYINDEKIDYLELSHKARKAVNENDPKWICVQDIFEFKQLGAKIILNEESNLEYVKEFKNGNPVNVRCISTSTGFYETNGFIHHNTARKLFYALSDTQVFNDCGGPYIDVMHCSLPEGHICKKCAAKTKGGHVVNEGMMVGGWVSTNMSEALTQLSMKQMHVGSGEVDAQLHGSKIIMNTLDGYRSSPIIQKMTEVKTTEEMREILYKGLKDQYEGAGIKQDDFNIMMVARKLTSYKRTNEGLKPIQPGEKADIVSMATVGNMNNIFKTSELTSGYKHLTKPQTQTLKRDAANDLLL